VQDLLILIFVSFAAGTLGSLLGLGGGFIIVPALTFLSFNPSQIASTSLFSVLSTSASSTIAYARQKRINYSLGIKFALISVPGAVIGAYISDFIDIGYFKLYFGLVLIGTSVYLLRKSSLERPVQRSSGIMVFCYIASFFAGILSSLFGVGGGVIFVPLMVAFLGMSMHISSPTSQFIILIASASGVVSHVAQGHPEYVQSLILIAGTFAGAQLGAKLLPIIKERVLQRLASIALFVVAARLISDAYDHLTSSG
jgi:hypothetical protein